MLVHVLEDRMEALSLGWVEAVGTWGAVFLEEREDQASKMLVPDLGPEGKIEEVLLWAVGKPAEGIVDGFVEGRCNGWRAG